MRLSFAPLILSVICLFATAAHADVGFQHFRIDDPQGAPIEVGVWYPTDAKASVQRLELGTQVVAPDAPVKGQGLALILLSHGHGGSYAGHADTAISLAQAGYVVAALTHDGDSWRDSSRAVEIWERPRQLKLLDDYMQGTWRDHGRLDPQRVGAFGFSAGGFTVLAAAGGVPDLTAMREHCRAHPTFEDCRIVAESKTVLGGPVTWVHDDRIRAVVSAAPALGFAFGKPGLAMVHVPVQLWRAADDRVLPNPFYAEAVRGDLPVPPDYHVVSLAGHYDFLAPCSQQLAQAVPAICASAPAFDRAAFHAVFNRDVVAFFNKAL
jgi:predicted dienelactone hydrolase